MFVTKKKTFCRDELRPSVRPFLNRPSYRLFMTQYQRLNSLSDFYEILYRSSLQQILGKRGYVKMYAVTDILHQTAYVNLYSCFPYFSKDLGEIKNRISLISLTYCEFHTNRCSKSHTFHKNANEILPHFLHFSSDSEKNSIRKFAQKLLNVSCKPTQ